MEETKNDWTITIIKKDGNVNFIYDKNVNRYELIGLLETELHLLKNEILGIQKK